MENVIITAKKKTHILTFLYYKKKKIQHSTTWLTGNLIRTQMARLAN